MILDREGTKAKLEALGSDATVLMLNCGPLHELVVGYGPFVMNTEAEIIQAMQDFQSGRFVLAKVSASPGAQAPRPAHPGVVRV